MASVAMRLGHSGDVLHIGLHNPLFSSHFPAFFRTEFTLPRCPKQEKMFPFDYSFCNQPHYQVTIFVLIICQDSQPFYNSLTFVI